MISHASLQFAGINIKPASQWLKVFEICCLLLCMHFVVLNVLVGEDCCIHLVLVQICYASGLKNCGWDYLTEAIITSEVTR